MIKRFIGNQLMLEALKRSLKMNIKTATKAAKKKYDESKLKERVEENKEKYEQSVLKVQVDKTKTKTIKLKEQFVKNAQEMGFGLKLRSDMTYKELLQLSREGQVKVKDHYFYLADQAPEGTEPFFILTDEALLDLLKEKEYQNSKFKIKIK